MTRAEDSDRLMELFHRVVDLPIDERRELLDEECAHDPDLRARIERLVQADGEQNPVLDELRVVERSDPMIGRELGSYRLEARVGSGGMGVVYRGTRTDGVFEREVAVKLVRIEALSEETLARFERERRALARLDHENVARLYDGGTTEEGAPYFVMEFVRGSPIDVYCDERRLSLTERLRLFATICRAVHFAHQNLVIHRDLKPGNILIDERGVPKLLDFGIARVLEDKEPNGVAAAGGAVHTELRRMTPEFASPEQLAGAPITTATDVYSLGVVLYSLLTGRRPFQLTTASPSEWERRIAEEAPPRPSTAARSTTDAAEGARGTRRQPEELAALRDTTPARLGHALAGDLDRIVLMALRKEPERRYSSAMDLAEDVERHLEGRPVQAREDSLLYIATRFAQRNRVGVGAAAAVLVALLVGIVVAVRGERAAHEQALRAEEEAAHARTEAISFQRTADFLMEAFLSADVLTSIESRDAAAALVRARAASVRLEYADDPHLRANLLDALGRVYRHLALPEAAEQLIVEALEIRRDEFGERSLEVALSLGSLGKLRMENGEFEDAIEHLSEALELHRTLPRGTHTDLGTSSNDLAVALRNVGAIEEAEALHREAVAKRREVVPDSPSLAESLNNLSGILLGRGDYAEAREILEEALAIRTRILGPDALLTAQTRSNLAFAAWGQGDAEGARALLEESEADFRSLGGLASRDLSLTLSSLGTLALERGDLDDAERRLTEALELQTAVLRPGHPDQVGVLKNLARLAAKRGRTDEARAIWDELVEIRRASLPPTSPYLGQTLQEQGAFLVTSGASADAEPALREALDLLLPVVDSAPVWVARAEIWLGQALRENGREDEGDERVEEGVARLESSGGATAAELEWARSFLRPTENAE